jgi:hypothetical protein
LEGIQEQLERAIAPDGEDAFAPSVSCFLCLSCEGCRALSPSQFGGPVVRCGKSLEIGKDSAAKATAGSGINEQKVR